MERVSSKKLCLIWLIRIWRWFHEEILSCSDKELMMKGMNLDQMTLLARCNGLHTQTFRPIDKEETESLFEEGVNDTLYVNKMDLNLFKTIIKATCQVEFTYSIVNFGRQEIKQTGTGHYSCVGGYHPASERVLILDTARFKYPPFWVEIDSLFQSINSIDIDNTDKKRGLIVVSKHQSFESQLLSDVVDKQIGIRLSAHLPQSVQSIDPMEAISQEQLSLILSSLNSVKPLLFKFIHDLYMVFTKINCPVVDSSKHAGLEKTSSENVCCPTKCSFGLN